MLLPQPIIRYDGPSTLEVMINDQSAQQRLVVHLLHYIPIRRSQIDIIEDVIPIYNVGLSIRADQSVKSVKLAPSGDAVEYEVADGRLRFNVPEVIGHQMIELNYGDE